MSSSSSGSIEGAAMALLEEALELPSAERQAFIEGSEGLGEDVRKLALQLLASEDDSHVSIKTGGAGDALHEDEIEPPELPGYEVIRQLGRGGMGAVFLAERSSGDFEHKVAIKVIKPGVLTDTLVDRFRRERQILARLNHPNIAHLYDGGETADGKPYIVMEYIQGRTLRDWLAEDRPSLESKLRLFLQAAEAVEFAHQNLIIHRDLTPNNVLVTDNGQAKLIDFGIARPQVEEGEVAVPSPLSGLSLTPGFAAPERSHGAGSNTLTDIYSLGRILSLMTGRTDEPELAAIAARASADDSAARFGSVSELIDEIENFRNKLPVVTFSETPGYRVRKFISREKVLVGAAAAIFLAILAGLVATGWAYKRAEDSRIIAEQRFEGLRDLAKFQLFDLYDELDHVVGTTAARLAVAERAQQYLVMLADSRSDDSELQLQTAEGFLKLALIQGVPAHPNFGEPELAAQNLERAEALFQPLSDAGLASADIGLARFEAYRSLLRTHAESDPDGALASAIAAEAALERVPQPERDWAWMDARRIVRVAALERADVELDTPVIESQVASFESDIADWPSERRGGYEEAFDRAMIRNFQAIVHHNHSTDEGYREATRLYLEADQLFEAMEADYANDPLTVYRRAWNAYYGYAAAATMDDMERADQLLAQARNSVEHLMTIEEGDNSLNTFEERLIEAQAEYFSNTERHDEAIAMMQGVIDGRTAKIGPDRQNRDVRDVAYGMAIFGSIYRKAGMREQACDAWIEAETLMAELADRDSLNGFIEHLRTGVVANLRRCRDGEPVTSFQPIS